MILNYAPGTKNTFQVFQKGVYQVFHYTAAATANDILDAIAVLQECCEELQASVESSFTSLNLKIDGNFDTTSRLLNRIFVDQRNQSQLIETLIRKTGGLQKDNLPKNRFRPGGEQ